jgi:hypothetical protein
VIQFLAPWAAVGAVLLAGPLLVHMLLRRNARHVVFPATRFLIETRAAAVRLRQPSDIALLLVRLGIVTAAIVAAARPLLLTPRRLAQWDARIIRAVVIDTTAITDSNSAGARLAEQELRSAFRATRFSATGLPDALERASAWLADAPPGRREIVIVSAFQRGVIDRGDLDVVPPAVGIRTVRAGSPAESRDARLPTISGFRGSEWQPSIHVEAAATGVTWTRSAQAKPLSWLSTSQAHGEDNAASRAVHAAVSAGVASGDERRRVRVRFAGAPAESTPRASVRTQWMVDATLALRRSGLLRQTNASITTVEHDGELVVETSARATSVDAPAVVRAVVLAVRPATIAERNAEVVTIPDAELARWRRDPRPFTPSRDGAPLGDGSDSDAKWFWALALALLGLDGWLRGTHLASRTEQQVRNAA